MTNNSEHDANCSEIPMTTFEEVKQIILKTINNIALGSNQIKAEFIKQVEIKF